MECLQPAAVGVSGAPVKRDRLTPSLWIGGPDAATAELPRGQGAFTFGPGERCRPFARKLRPAGSDAAFLSLYSYRGACLCGWTGEPRVTLETAKVEASAHGGIGAIVAHSVSNGRRFVRRFDVAQVMQDAAR